MSSDAVPVTIQVLDKDYTVACPPEEKEGLLESAELLNRRMREVRDSGKVMGAERMAVMTALNMANDLLRTSNLDKEIGTELPPRLKDLESRISRVLEQARQLEI